MIKTLEDTIIELRSTIDQDLREHLTNPRLLLAISDFVKQISSELINVQAAISKTIGVNPYLPASYYEKTKTYNSDGSYKLDDYAYEKNHEQN